MSILTNVTAIRTLLLLHKWGGYRHAYHVTPIINITHHLQICKQDGTVRGQVSKRLLQSLKPCLQWKGTLSIRSLQHLTALISPFCMLNGFRSKRWGPQERRFVIWPSVSLHFPFQGRLWRSSRLRRTSTTTSLLPVGAYRKYELLNIALHQFVLRWKLMLSCAKVAKQWELAWSRSEFSCC